MNNNTKRNRKALSKLKAGEEIELNIPAKRSGNHGADYEHRTQWIKNGQQPRLSKRPKVAAAR